MSNKSDMSDFDAAKAIADVMAGMPKDRQQRILRWVMESCGLPSQVAFPAQHTTQVTDGPEAPAPVTPPVGAVKTTDIKSFVEAKRPKSDTQFAVVVAYYYRFEAPENERKDRITAAVLQDATRLCSRKRIPLARRTLFDAKNQGYLDSPGRGEFRINSVGENLVVMTLSGRENDPGPAAKLPPRRRTGAKNRKRTNGRKRKTGRA